MHKTKKIIAMKQKIFLFAILHCHEKPIDRKIAYLIRVGGHYALRIEVFTV